MQKVKVTLCYDGSDFWGSQIQPKKKTVHGVLQTALKHLNIDTKLEFSGRTDKDVHAFRQVVSFLLPEYWSDLNKLQKTLNKLLPQSVFIRSIYRVDKEFHARFSAKAREYRYIFTDQKLSPFQTRFISYFETINEKKIQETLKHFYGVHDFNFFSKNGSDPKSTIRELKSIKLYKFQGYYILKFQANSYLRSQIRMMVEFIMKISKGELSLEDLELQLSCKKQISTTLAPPNGLYLSRILY